MKLHHKIIGIIFLAAITAILTSAMMQVARPPMANIQLAKMNVVYIGIDNPVTVNVDGVSPSQIQLISHSESATVLFSGRPREYTIRVTGGTKLELQALDTSGPGSRQCGWLTCRVKKIPDPYVYVGGIRRDTIMSKAKLQQVSGVLVHMENFDFEVTSLIDSFCVSVIKNNEWKTYTAHGPAIIPEMKTAFQNSKTGDKIIFHDVVVKMSDGTTRRLNGPVITVE